jgi:hypothetical protein
MKGLPSHAERKNGWQLAEEAGERTPDGMQRLLNASRWDVDAVRDDLLAYVSEQLADSAAVLVIDETGFVKKGTKSVGVKRQYNRTAGKREICQVEVFVTYSSLVPAQTQVRDWFAAQPVDAYPNLVALAGQLAEPDQDRRFEVGLQIVLDGLERRLAASGGGPRS